MHSEFRQHESDLDDEVLCEVEGCHRPAMVVNGYVLEQCSVHERQSR